MLGGTTSARNADIVCKCAVELASSTSAAETTSICSLGSHIRALSFQQEAHQGPAIFGQLQRLVVETRGHAP